MPTITAVAKPMTWPVSFTPHASDTVQSASSEMSAFRSATASTAGSQASGWSVSQLSWWRPTASPAIVDPGGQALHRAAEMPDEPSVITRSRAGLAPHRPDPWAARDHQLAGELEAIAAVPGEVPLVGGLQVGRHTVGVDAGEHLSQQGRAQPLSLGRRLGAQDKQIPVGPIVRVLLLHALQPTQHRRGPQPNEPDQGREQPQPLRTGQLPAPRRREPDRGRGSTGGHPDLVVGEGQLAKAELHEGRQDSAATLVVREDPGNDRVVLEG